MLFNSVAFALFLPIVFGLYWLIGARRIRLQNILLILASFVFYGWWDYRFVLLLLASTSFDFFVGIQLGRFSDERHRRWFFRASIIANLTALGFFKYFNFFAENFERLLHSVGIQAQPILLQIILPVGISFYTFHSMSYVIDVYRRHREPCRDATAYFAFISFFPLLVAGPIVRATWFLPQFQAERKFEPPRAADGMRQMLWGFFKKMVIADGCAQFVNPIFDTWQSQPAGMLVAGAVLFAFQIYGDFSGYSDIAIGCARLFGFHLLPNFRYPFFAQNFVEFWRRWHISLTSWFRDYVYFPLGGSRGGQWQMIRNTMLVFLLSGFWHGASWTMIAWGGLHGLFILPTMLLQHRSGRKKQEKPWRWTRVPGYLLGVLITFTLFCLTLVVFRSADMGVAVAYLERIGRVPWGALAIERRIGVFILIMLIAEWFNRHQEHGLTLNGVPSRVLRWAIYLCLATLIFFFGAPPQTFFYFQF